MLTDVLVPGNRWDLLAPYPVPRPRVTVVVTHYEQPDQLARTLAALRRQTLPAEQVVVADDGSASPPPVARHDPRVQLVTQPDRGFRAAAARNLGARHAVGEVLVFLDADTTPEPGFLAALTRHVAVCPDVLAVGRRRHADLGGTAPGDAPAVARRLAEPAWLRAGYTAQRDLLDADGRSFRFVISAVLACRRSLFTDLGGFDERFVGYGGEDWDLAYRAWNAGAVLVHEPDAVAWHDGPDAAGRPGDPAVKDAESLRLAALVPEPHTRGAPLPGALPDVLLDVPAGRSAGETARIVHSLLRQDHRDLRIRLPEPVDAALSELYAGIAQLTPWTDDQLHRARFHGVVRAPMPPASVGRAVELLVTGDLGRVTLREGSRCRAVLTSTRATGRTRRWAHRLPADTVLDAAFGAATMLVAAGPPARDDLAGFFAAGARSP